MIKLQESLNTRRELQEQALFDLVVAMGTLFMMFSKKVIVEQKQLELKKLLDSFFWYEVEPILNFSSWS
jgi:hypothetical protein